MNSIKVNADYESVLFTGKPNSKINEALEFLAFFIDERPVFTHKKYSSAYLEHVSQITGRVPKTVNHGDYGNWWGALKNLELEKKLNSKLTSAELNFVHHWDESIILYEESELSKINWNRDYLLKDPNGMSGRGLSRVSIRDEVKIESYPVIIEPLDDRKYDFSHYIFPDGRIIAYQNLVDQRFQYRGTLFQNYRNPRIEELSFFSEVKGNEWSKFNESLSIITDYYQKKSNGVSFSIDSYVYKEKKDFKIRALSEVNMRRTMGSVAFELALRIAHDRLWCMFLLGKLKRKMSFNELKTSIDNKEGIYLLSPEDSRFQIFFLCAKNDDEGKELFNQLQLSLPDCQFSIEI